MASFQNRIKNVFDDYLLKLATLPEVQLPWQTLKRTEDDGLKRSAVLCCLTEINDDIHVLITTRSQELSTHPGEPCLPGGKEEPTDVSLVDTALREAEEEVGLRRDQVQVVAALPPLPYGMTIYMQCYMVVCTVLCASVDQLDLRSSSEVDSIHWVPLRMFLGGGHHHKKRMFYSQIIDANVTVSFFKVVEKTESRRAVVVWGLTARMCIMVACIALSLPPCFPCNLHYIRSVDTYTIYFSPFLIPSIENGIVSKL